MSETDFLKLKKHDNVESNTEKFDIENYLNGNWDKINENAKKVNTDILNINSKNKEQDTNIEQLQENTETSSNKIAELETELKEMQEDFYQASIRGQASGEYIHVEDSSNCRARIGIGGNSKQETREGYNIAKINTDNFELTNNTIKNKSTTVGGNILTHIKLKAGQTITSNLLLLSKPSKDTSFSVRIGSSDVANLSFSKFDELNLNTKQSKIYTATEDVEFDVKIWGNANKDIFEFQYWVTIGTEEKDYELYGASPSPDYPSEVESCGDNGSITEVICNKNWFDKDKAITKKGWFDNNGKITYEGNSTIIENYIKIPNNKNITINAKGLEHIVLYNKDKEFIKRVSIRDKDQYTFKEENVYFIRFQMITSKLDLNSIQIEEGSIATEFEEYKSQTYTIPTQQPMRSVGDIRDTFIKKNNKWFERHYIYRQIFDGTEDWNLYTSDNARRFGLSITGNIPKLITTTYNGRFGKGLCSHFGTQMNYTTTDLILFVQIANPIWYIGITDFNSKWANVTALKEWLSSQYNAGTPVYVDYVLEEPLDIECTEEQSKILDELNNARTYKNVTNIYSTDKISPIIDLDYAKDLETLLNNTQALAVNNASEGV